MTVIKYPYKVAADLARAVLNSKKREEVLDYIQTAHKLYELSIQNAETIRELKGQLYIAHAEIRLLKQQKQQAE